MPLFPHVKMENFMHDGRVDWDAYHRAEEANGERCTRCGGYIMFPAGKPSLCGNCQLVDEDVGEVMHGRFVRCPSCQHKWDPSSEEMYEVFADGDHEIGCPKCEHEFTVQTIASYTFTSPALVAKEEKVNA